MRGQDVTFDHTDAGALLDQLDDRELDDLDFGVVRMDQDARVVSYNRAESELSGLDRSQVVGENFFIQVAPCANNYLVAQRYLDEEDLDDTIEYIFTYRMLPTPVLLRLIRRPGMRYRYLLVRRA